MGTWAIDELKTRLDGLEWNDIEFKEAAWKVPRNFYETVSAFSNTCGGWIAFGIFVQMLLWPLVAGP